MTDGHVNKCKECNKIDVSKNYRKNRGHYMLYEKQRFQKEERKQYCIEQQRKRRSKNEAKYKANTAVSNAVRDGRIIKKPCEICGDKAQAHHEDYTKPLDVKWLCRKHHLKKHNKESYSF